MVISPSVREVLARRIAGEIILSGKPGASMRKWRELFVISQLGLSEAMCVSSSVISDYESGRRKSPGAKFIRRFVLALLQFDESKGGRFVQEFAKLTSSPSMAIIDLREFPIPVRIEYLRRAVNGNIVTSEEQPPTPSTATTPSTSSASATVATASSLSSATVVVGEVNGYTVVDSKCAVEVLSGYEYAQLFGASTERALIFTNVENSILPLMIIRVCALKPKVIIFHKTLPDKETVQLAEYEQIPLIYSPTPLTVEQLVKSLRKLYRVALRIKLGRRVHPPPKIST
jgi:putative transcriptional regulator